MSYTITEMLIANATVAVVAWLCGRASQWAMSWRTRDQLERLQRAARGVLDLMDDVPIDVKLGDETDRVYARWELEDLRSALEDKTVTGS